MARGGASEVRSVPCRGDICVLPVRGREALILRAEAGQSASVGIGRGGVGERVWVEGVEGGEVGAGEGGDQGAEEGGELCGCGYAEVEKGGAFVGAEAGEDRDFLEVPFLPKCERRFGNYSPWSVNGGLEWPADGVVVVVEYIG